MRLLLGIMFCLSASPVFAGADMLIGSWEGGDTASMSIYGIMHISKTTISWGGHSKYHPKCQVSYAIEPEKLGVEFKDQTGNTFVTSENSKFSTYLLKINEGKCTSGVSSFRLTFPFPLESEFRFTYLEMVEYNKSGRPLGWMHFHRQDQ